MNKIKDRLICLAMSLITSGIMLSPFPALAADESVKIGFNYPETGPYAKQGLDQRRAAELAAGEINASGGILGKKVQLLFKDSQSNTKTAKQNAIDLFDKDGVAMLFGGVSSGEAIANGKVAKQKNKLFFGTLGSSTEITGEEGHKFIFRDYFDSYMSAKVLSNYLNKNFAGKKFFYIASDYSWGWTTEDVFRKFTNTTDKNEHKGLLTKLGSTDYKEALQVAKESNAAVLVMVLFGRDMEIALKQADEMGLKKTMQLVFPSITLDAVEGVGAEVAEGIVGAKYWTWQVPYQFNYPKGKAFVENFGEKYHKRPSMAAAPAYVILHQYKEAVELAKSFDTNAVIKALEGHKYTGLKDEQQWRAWDHQSIGTVYAVKCKPAAEVRKDKFKQDFFEIITSMKGEDAAINFKEWSENRAKVGMPATLE